MKIKICEKEKNNIFVEENVSLYPQILRSGLSIMPLS